MTTTNLSTADILERLRSIAHTIAEVEKDSFASFTGSEPLTEAQINSALLHAIEIVTGTREPDLDTTP